MAIARYSAVRVVGVTAGLILAGAFFGGLAGVLVFVIGEAPGHWSAFLNPWLYAYGAIVGVPLGALCAPIAGWMLLRDVPLGRAFLVATVGTIVGGTIGEMAGFSVAVLIAGGAIGCLLSAVLLRIYNRQRRTKAEATDGAA